MAELPRLCAKPRDGLDASQAAPCNGISGDATHPHRPLPRRINMIRRNFIAALGGLFVAHRLAGAADAPPPAKVEKLKLSEDEWHKRLTPEQFAVLRQDATERPGSSPFNPEKGHRR